MLLEALNSQRSRSLKTTPPKGQIASFGTWLFQLCLYTFLIIGKNSVGFFYPNRVIPLKGNYWKTRQVILGVVERKIRRGFESFLDIPVEAEPWLAVSSESAPGTERRKDTC